MQKLKGKGYENRGIAVDVPQNQSLKMKDVACERERACNIGIVIFYHQTPQNLVAIRDAFFWDLCRYYAICIFFQMARRLGTHDNIIFILKKAFLMNCPTVMRYGRFARAYLV